MTIKTLTTQTKTHIKNHKFSRTAGDAQSLRSSITLRAEQLNIRFLLYESLKHLLTNTKPAYSRNKPTRHACTRNEHTNRSCTRNKPETHFYGKQYWPWPPAGRITKFLENVCRRATGPPPHPNYFLSLYRRMLYESLLFELNIFCFTSHFSSSSELQTLLHESWLFELRVAGSALRVITLWAE